MITIFEKFEYDSNRYWKVRVDTPYFEIALDKLGLDADRKRAFLNHESRKEMERFSKYVYIGYDSGDDSTYGEFYYALRKNYWDKQGYEYMGEFKLTKDDLEEWYTKQDAKKYNL